MPQPLAERRAKLERFAARYFKGRNDIRLSPAARDVATAKKWFRSTGGDLDGIIAKRIDMPYRSGMRDGMQKIKHRRTSDCVVGDFRYAQRKKVLGSLLLGPYDDEGLLHHVGFTSSFKEADRKRITEKVAGKALDVVDRAARAAGVLAHSKLPVLVVR